MCQSRVGQIIAMPHGSLGIAVDILSLRPVPNENAWPCGNAVNHPICVSIGDFMNNTKNTLLFFVRIVGIINEKASHALLVSVGPDHFSIISKLFQSILQVVFFLYPGFNFNNSNRHVRSNDPKFSVFEQNRFVA